MTVPGATTVKPVCSAERCVDIRLWLPFEVLSVESRKRDVVTDPNDAVIIETIIAMARNLGLEVVAEGVESGPILEALKARACILYQGHHFSAAVPEDALLELLRQGVVGARPGARRPGRAAV